MSRSQDQALFAEIPPDESATINGARRYHRACPSPQSAFPKSSEAHYRDTLRILYPDLVVVTYNSRRGTHVKRYYRH